MPSKRKITEAREKALKESFAAKRKKLKESGSDHLRGKNEEGQIRAIWAKDPHGDYHPDAD